MRSRLLTFAVIVAGLALTGAVADRAAQPAWNRMRAKEPTLRLESTAAAAGQGVTLALLGGFRALVADFTWLKLHLSWERRDLATADALVRLVPAIDARPRYFWLNGARIMAYDFAAWRIEAAGGYDAVPATEQQRIVRDQARLALAHLDAAMKFHPQSHELWTERANIELNRLRDLGAAAESYRRAWEMPQAPYYVARLRGEMLRRLGRNAEALAWLVELHPQLPRRDEAAGADLVLERIRVLERQLNIPPERAYRPPE